MAKVLVSDKLSPDGLEILEQAEDIECEYKPGLDEEELAKTIGPFDGLIIRSGSKVTGRVIEAATNLRAVGRAGIGVDNVDVAAASRRGIVVMNTPTGNAVTTAEHAITLLMSLARRVPQASATMKDGRWDKSKFQGREMTSKTLGVIGLGNIGRIVANRARGLHMKVIGFDPVVSSERAAELGVELVTLAELFKRADAITVHTPLTKETESIVNDGTIATMKKGVLLVNAARGGVYDEAALLRGLESGQIGGVALDVYREEPPGATDLVKHPNVVATPHLGASTSEAQTRVAVEIAHQVIAYLRTGTIANAVNVASIPQEVAPLLAPYLTLSRRLGQFIGQVESIQPRALEVECAGEAAGLAIPPIVNTGLSGLLEQFLESPVNHISAPHVAADRGIDVRELRTSKADPFTTLIRLTVTGEDGEQATVSGTLAADRSPRLVRWGRHELDAHVEGSMLVLRNADRPGVIGRIGSILGDAKINVSRIQLARVRTTGTAASLWALDGGLPPEVLDSIRAAKGVDEARVVVLT